MIDCKATGHSTDHDKNAIITISINHIDKETL